MLNYCNGHHRRDWQLTSQNMAWPTSRSQSMTIVMLFFLTLWTVASSQIQHSPGYITPNDTLYWNIGDSINITCVIFNGSPFDLSFEVTSKTGNGPKLRTNVSQSNNDLIVLNSTSVMLMVRNMSESVRTYQCMDQGKYAIQEVQYTIGSKPQKLSSLDCINYDYREFRCYLKYPYNEIKTTYKLILDNDNYCDAERDENTPNDEVYNCTLTNKYDPPPSHVLVVGENKLGEIRYQEKFKGADRVIPKKPTVRDFELIGSDTIKLRWGNSHYVYYGNSTVDNEITLKPHGLEDLNDTRSFECMSNLCEYNLTLKYANYNYTFTLRSRVHRDNLRDDELWSDMYVSETFTSKATKPKRPPNVTETNYYINPNENEIRLYWEEMPAYEYSGPGFKYVIKRNGKFEKTTTKPSTTLPYKRNEVANFTIQAANQIGLSDVGTTIRVYPINPSLSPSDVRSVYKNSVYETIWTAPQSNRSDISKYYVFWCSPKIEAKTQCEGGVSFKELHRSATNYTSQSYNITMIFAVAAVYKDGSNSGMHWRICSDDASAELSKPKVNTPNAKATTIALEWTTDICFSILDGFNITYCESNDCDSTKRTHRATKSLYQLENLKPFTNYSIWISMHSKTKSSLPSFFENIETKESAPSSPRNVTIVTDLITHSSVGITWLPPKYLNGILRKYTIHLIGNNETKTVECGPGKCSGERRSDFFVDSLDPYTEYEIRITAHTIADSEPSESVKFRTSIGIPSSPLINSELYKDEIIEWLPPQVKAGRIDFYVVEFRSGNDTKRVAVSGNSCKFKQVSCFGEDSTYSLRVRAVNVASREESRITQRLPHTTVDNRTVDPVDKSVKKFECFNAGKVNTEGYDFESDNQTIISDGGEKTFYSSSWVSAREIKCGHSGSVGDMILLYSGIFLVVGILVGFGKYAFVKISYMKNIEVILPAGLEIKPDQSKSSFTYEDERPTASIVNSSDCLLRANEDQSLLRKQRNGIINMASTPIETPPNSSGNESPKSNNYSTDCNESSDVYNNESIGTTTSHLPLNDGLSQYEESGESDCLQRDPLEYVKNPIQHSSKLPNIIPVDKNSYIKPVIQVSPNGYIPVDGYIKTAPTGYIHENKLNSTAFQGNTFRTNNNNNDYTQSSRFIAPAKVAV